MVIINIPHKASSLPIPWPADLPSQLSHGETSIPLQGSLPAQNVLYYHDVDHNNADDADDDDDNVDNVGDDNLYRWLWLLGNREPGKSILTTLLMIMMMVELNYRFTEQLELNYQVFFSLGCCQVKYFLPRLLVFWSRTVLSEYCTLSSI